MKRSSALLVLGAGLFLVAAPLHAQGVGSTGIGMTRNVLASAHAPFMTVSIAQSDVHRHRRWPFVLGGAVVGATAAGLVLANGIRHTDDAMAYPEYVVGFVGVGAGIGALGGWAVSAMVR